jgi:hypothetical protein
MASMSDDEIETRVQKFCDAHRDGIKFAIEHNIIKPGNRMLGHDGKKRFEAGLRDLIPAIDNSQLPAAAYEALQKIITGVTLVTFGAAYTEATKNVIDRERARAAGKASAKIKRSEVEEGWMPHALELAVAIRKEDKAITQVNLAPQIKSRWRLRLKCPESQLILAISRWEREGKLPRRCK